MNNRDSFSSSLQKAYGKGQHELPGVIEWQAEEPISVFLFDEFVPGDKHIREVKAKGSN
jgi:hypothetical protein